MLIKIIKELFKYMYEDIYTFKIVKIKKAKTQQKLTMIV